jgi:hypothetical protein
MEVLDRVGAVAPVELAYVLSLLAIMWQGLTGK